MGSQITDEWLFAAMEQEWKILPKLTAKELLFLSVRQIDGPPLSNDRPCLTNKTRSDGNSGTNKIFFFIILFPPVGRTLALNLWSDRGFGGC